MLRTRLLTSLLQLFRRGGDLRRITHISFCIVICVLATQLFVLLFPFSAEAADKTVGVIMTGNIPYYQDLHKGFIMEIQKDKLFQEGKIDIILQKPAPSRTAWTNAARKLVSLDVDVIVSYGTPSTLAVQDQTSHIPVVFAAVYDYETAGIKGKNITGITSKVPVSTLIKNMQSISKSSKFGVVYSRIEKDTILQANDIKGLEGKHGFKTFFIDAEKKNEADKINKVDTLILTTSCAAMTCVDNYVLLASNARIPTASLIGGAEEKGILLTLSANPLEQGRKAAQKTVEILKGASPSSIKIDSPSQVNMILNMKAAKQLGLTVPFEVLTSATKVIK